MLRVAVMLFLTLCLPLVGAELNPFKPVPEVDLKDGRMLKDFVVKSYTSDGVRGAWKGGEGIIGYDLFPEEWSQFLIRFRPKTAPQGLAKDIPLGLPEADLLKVKGKPTAKAAVRGKVIYQWPDMEVSVESGKVASVSRKNQPSVSSDSGSISDKLAPDILGFRSLKWGDDLTTLEGFSRISTKGRLAAFARLDEDKMIGVVRAENIFYETVDNKLARVTIFSRDPAAPKALRNSMEARYGGFAGDERMQLWGFPGDGKQGMAFLMVDRVNGETRLHIYSRKLSEESEAINKAQQAAGGKDL